MTTEYSAIWFDDADDFCHSIIRSKAGDMRFGSEVQLKIRLEELIDSPAYCGGTFYTYKREVGPDKFIKSYPYGSKLVD